ncbi:MAG: hypothetical protein R6U31_01340 [bacterium]
MLNFDENYLTNIEMQAKQPEYLKVNIEHFRKLLKEERQYETQDNTE